jgi:threonine/homoserine/homoserine lactone efflux protein
LRRNALSGPLRHERDRAGIDRWLQRLSAAIFGGLAIRLLMTDAR